MRYRWKHRFEYGVLRVVAAVMNVLPYRVALALAWVLAWGGFNLVRFRRREALRRIEQVYGERFSVRERRRIAWLSLRNLFFNAVEMMRAPRIDKRWIERHMPEFAAHMPRVKEIIAEYGGAVIAVPHCGNWDLAGWACYHHGISMFSIAAKQKNPLVNDWINRQRESGMTVLERGGGTLKQIIRLLREGNVLAILPDVRMPTPDLELGFLGGRANFGRGMAMFAIAAKVPIILATFRRVGWARHAFDYHEPLFPDAGLSREEDARRMTAEVVERVDRAIGREPEQWFWYNKRWILTPVRR